MAGSLGQCIPVDTEWNDRTGRTITKMAEGIIWLTWTNSCLLSSSTESIPETCFRNRWSSGWDDGSLVTSNSGVNRLSSMSSKFLTMFFARYTSLEEISMIVVISLSVFDIATHDLVAKTRVRFAFYNKFFLFQIIFCCFQASFWAFLVFYLDLEQKLTKVGESEWAIWRSGSRHRGWGPT